MKRLSETVGAFYDAIPENRSYYSANRLCTITHYRWDKWDRTDKIRHRLVNFLLFRLQKENLLTSEKSEK